MDTYRKFWDAKASDPTRATEAVDGSPDEETARATGAWAARQVGLALAIDANDDLLEIGCGIGRIGRELAPGCKSWTGVDVSSNMLRTASQRMRGLKNVSFQRASRSDFAAFDDGVFDKAYSVAVFCHLHKEDVFLYLRDLYRVLKPGGAAYLEMWNLANPVTWKFWLLIVEAWHQGRRYPREEVGRNQFSVPEEAQLFLEKTGFETVACYTGSPWIQMIAVKPGDEERRNVLCQHVEKHRQNIANSARWGELFDRLLQVRLGGASAREYLDWLEQQPSDRDIDLYRLFVSRTYGLDTNS